MPAARIAATTINIMKLVEKVLVKVYNCSSL
jgi:hypothetical protein